MNSKVKIQKSRVESIKQDLINTIADLERDARFTFDCFHKAGRGGWPIPIYAMQLYTFAVIDYLSSLWSGWNDLSNRPLKESRKQTQRMVDFLERYLKYGQAESIIAIDIWRHKLMHTAHPRILKGDKIYRWLWNYELPPNQHWKFHPNGIELIVSIGFFNLLRDLKLGVKKYGDELAGSEELQFNYERTMSEFGNYESKYGR